MPTATLTPTPSGPVAGHWEGYSHAPSYFGPEQWEQQVRVGFDVVAVLTANGGWQHVVTSFQMIVSRYALNSPPLPRNNPQEGTCTIRSNNILIRDSLSPDADKNALALAISLASSHNVPIMEPGPRLIIRTAHAQVVGRFDSPTNLKGVLVLIGCEDANFFAAGEWSAVLVNSSTSTAQAQTPTA
jgi:hypothetical protein